MAVFEIYVMKRREFAVEAAAVYRDLRDVLGISAVTGVRIVNRYFVDQIDSADFAAARDTIFSEPQVDDVFDSPPQLEGCQVLGVEYLPGQFDQRADSCAQCISLATGKERPRVQTAKLYYIETAGGVTENDMARIKKYVVNPVESREASLKKPDTLEMQQPEPEDVPRITGFTRMDQAAREKLLAELGLAMDAADLAFCQAYFRDTEQRDPSMTEIRLIDTYWSDHCRHTTFLTELDKVEIADPEIAETYSLYLDLREELYPGANRPITLMDMGTIAAKALKKRGILNDLDESEEINACSVKIKVDVDGTEQDWLLMFKNETHNHPTEIEPFGGAATCLGGAIRDPLSGRSYVYQAMRITGAGNPLARYEETLPGKLPQRKIVRTAAEGYSSYGNQIGLPTGLVKEVYHPGYVAKRMEIGAVVGAAPAENVVRERPAPGDMVILLGGKTGRDGCGGATGSSKSHTAQSLEDCGAEVQKGNPPEERKLQRLFRNPAATRLIKRCNDFGAGGVSVSIGELADGIRINLDKVPKKYDGLTGTELAISESQERMSVVIAPEDVDAFIALAQTENIEATVVAEVTEQPRMTMDWRGDRIVDLARTFLDSNGASRRAEAKIAAPQPPEAKPNPVDGAAIQALLGTLNAACQKGLVDRFDSSIGAGSVLVPYGGARQMSPAQVMAAKIPVLGGATNTASVMSWGFDPHLSAASPYHGGLLAVVESVSRVVAAGGTRARCWLTLQEYFEKLRGQKERWGKPAAAILGALRAQIELGCGAIGGKDSMSGTFEDIDVPPTLVSFAISTTKADHVVSGELKQAGSPVYLLLPKYNGVTPDFESLRRTMDKVELLIAQGQAAAVWALGMRGTAEALPKMCFGNRIGFAAENALEDRPMVGGFVVEATSEIAALSECLLGRTIPEYELRLPQGTAGLQELQDAYTGALEPVYALTSKQQPAARCEAPAHTATERRAPKMGVSRPTVLIPVFPGTNCEYDTARAFERAGANAEVFVVRNLSASDIRESLAAFEKQINRSQIIALPGGFSGGDEPEGSAKFITAFFRNPAISQAVLRLLNERDGLMCGICNGFQALVKLGLLPYGDIRPMDANCATLTYNTIGRHQATLVRTRVASNTGPWLSRANVGDVYWVPISHGEGRFIAAEPMLRELAQNGQLATQYVDEENLPTTDIRYNPNNSCWAIEGILSPDGRIFGKMGHTERWDANLYRNVPGTDSRLQMFEGAVDYYRV